ncbi:hypothetical protein EST38_g13966 [Candolleomyces aberdarensis]|uniref:Uncharacterized protein n=1 Tax=Candolleomyces aberdarensis TaxID=2316362 RepID=A0A4Q2D0X8_9AGAR|nr:hypothetical protein EST38_g13966 [Candolleomyces aberdarensis]
MNHAPTKLLAGFGPSCRTSQEVKAANKAADAAAEKAREKAHIHQAQVKKRIGELEDELQREDAHRKKTAARPDLHEKPIAPIATKLQKKGNEKTHREKLKIIIKPPASKVTNQDAHPSMQDPGSMGDGEADSMHHSQSPSPTSASENGLNVPTGSDNEFVDGQTGVDSEYASGEQETPDEAEAAIFESDNDGDREDDLDYKDGGEEEEYKSEEEASDDGDGNHRQRRKLSKAPPQKKTEKALKFREEVSKHRKTKSTSSISQAVQNEIQKRKRRALEDESDAGEHQKNKAQSNLKQPKYQEPSGLLGNFRSIQWKKLNMSRSQSEPSDGDEYNGGIFDHDEDEDTLRLARESKAKASIRGSQSTLIAWNAALRQPFSSGTLLSSEVRVVWRKVFKDLAPLEDDDERWTIVETVAGNFLLNWRSEIGKTAITVTISTLRNELMDRIEDGEGDEAGVAAATYLLKDYQFVYGNPDAEADESARPFESAIILQTFTFHVRQVVYLIKNYKTGGNAIGALALCAAAVEQALTLVRDRNISIAQWPPVLLPPVPDAASSAGSKGSGKRRKAMFTPFSESAWGYQTHGFVGTAENLSRERWDSIVEGSTTEDIELLLDALDENEDDLFGSGGTTVRANADSRSKLCT